MPITVVHFFAERDGSSPVVEWLEDLRAEDLLAYAKCAAVIGRLMDFGHELRRPTADYLCNGLFELRARRGHVNYRLFYFFHGKHRAVLVHAVTKHDVIAITDLNRARDRKRRFELAPEQHTYHETS